MIRAALSAGLTLLAAGVAFGQTAAAPSFEVASIKPSPPPTDGRLRIMMGGGPGDSHDPGRFTWENVSLRDIVRAGYGVKDYQITGPDWMNSTRFNVIATVPPGTSKETAALMWQSLLKDRFGMEIRREKKDLPAYALVVAKGGPKMPEATNDESPTADGPSGPAVRGGFGGGPGGGPGGARGGMPMRNGMMMMRGNGHLEAKGIPLAQFVDMLARQLDRPVEDQTGLKANYDIKLDYTPDESTSGVGPKMGIAPPMQRPDGGEGPDRNSEGNAPTLFTALQTQLGLKLETKKLPLDMLIVEHAEKVPTEN